MNDTTLSAAQANMNTPMFPFAAIVGQDNLKLALLLCAVNPSLAGVLIRGDKGAAKSTAARGLRELLVPIERVPGCPYNCAPGAALEYCDACRPGEGGCSAPVLSPVPFVDLPLGATEDRVLGSLDLERVLKEGRRAFQPGLLAAAHRGILYIDEVNLLADHLVDSLLDVAAMGQHTVQREGLSLSHPARVTLIGTMNAEEGELRPQLLDRFAMMVDVHAPAAPAERAEVVRRRLAFEDDPHAFVARWASETERLRKRIQAARARLHAVTLPESLLEFISELCCEFGATSLRADITLNKAARTHCAFDGRDVVSPDDVALAARLVLPHRRRRKPFEQPGLDEERLDEAIARARDRTRSGDQEGDGGRGGDDASRPDASGASERTVDNDTRGDTLHPQADPPPESSLPPEPSAGAADEVFGATQASATPRLQVDTGAPAGAEGRRSVAVCATRGAYTRAVPATQPRHLAADATLRHAILREPRALNVTRADLHDKVLTGRQAHLILLVVDASGSMAARRRMEAVKNCVLGLLDDAYRRRDAVGVIAFRGERAELILPPTRSIELAHQALERLPTGGRTPLTDALSLTATVLDQADRSAASDTRLVPLVVLLTDGGSNVSGDADHTASADSEAVWRQTLAAAAQVAERKVAALVLDTEQGFVKLARAKALADAMRAEYLPLDQWSSRTLAVTIRERLC